MNPVYGSMNKPMLVFGIDKRAFFGIAMLGVLAFWMVGLIAAICVFGGLFAAVVRATRKDHALPLVIIDRIKLSSLYDSAAR